MTRRPSRHLAALGFAAAAVALAVFGSWTLTRTDDTRPASSSSAIVTPAARGVVTVAERPSDRPLLSPALLSATPGHVAVGAAMVCLAGTIVDRRLRALARNLGYRRRGPPALFTV